jgi:hypothetical protein
MLKEISNLNDTSDNLKRRWFTDNRLDLYVWVDQDGNIVEFQLSYNKPQDERIVKWTRKNGLSHYHVENGDPSPYKADASAILQGEAKLDIAEVRKIFKQSAPKLDHDLHEFIITRLTPDQA